MRIRSNASCDILWLKVLIVMLARLFFVIIMILTLVPLHIAKAEMRTYDLAYHVQWGDSPLGKALAKWKLGTDSYRFDGTVKTEGTLSFFYDFEGENTLVGDIIDGSYRPSQFTSISTYDDETYEVDMSWPKGLPRPVFKVEPKPEKGKVHPLRAASLRNVVDPYTAMLMALADLEATDKCDGVYRVFDGRRRSELHLKDFGTTTLVADTDWAYSGPAHICGSASKMIGGHKIKKNQEDDEEMDFEKVQIFVARPDGKTLMPVRMELNSFLGSVIVRLNMTTSQFN